MNQEDKFYKYTEGCHASIILEIWEQPKEN